MRKKIARCSLFIQRKFLLSFALLAILFNSTGCSLLFPGRSKKVPVQIYFPEKNELFIVPILRYVSKPVTPQMLLGELEKGPRNRGVLLNALPDEKISLKLKTIGRTIQLNFATPSLPRNWHILMTCVIATFQQLSDYDTVQFLQGGKPGMGGEGEEIGKEPLRNFWVNDNMALSNPGSVDEETRKIIVYYRLKGTNYLVPVTLHLLAGKPIEEEIAEAVEEDSRLPWILVSPLPAGSEILYVSRSADNIVEMAVSLKGGEAERKLGEKALVLAFTGIPGVKYVRIRHGRGFLGWRSLQKRPISVNMEEGYGD